MPVKVNLRASKNWQREEKSGRFLQPPGWTGHLVTAADAEPTRIPRRKRA